MKGGGRGGVTMVGAAGVEVTLNVLTEPNPPSSR
jgi:hypothetical protein